MAQQIIMAVASTDNDQVLSHPVVSLHDSIDQAMQHFLETQMKPLGQTDLSEVEVKHNADGTTHLTFDAEGQLLATIKVVI